MRIAAFVIICFVVLATAGCVRRTITINSSPSGALVWLNDREVGRTPIDVDFVYYGDYDVRIEHEHAEPVMTGALARPPFWDIPPFDFIAELLPLELHSRVDWHFDLPPRQADPDSVRERAEAFRRQSAAE